jgi:hypothetical protein
MVCKLNILLKTPTLKSGFNIRQAGFLGRQRNTEGPLKNENFRKKLVTYYNKTLGLKLLMSLVI